MVDIEQMPARRQVIGIVEDDPSMLKGVRRLLSASGYDTEVFASAEAFLPCAATSKASCRVADIHLREIAGIELHRRWTASGFNLPAIFMTAVDTEATKKEATENEWAA